MLALCASQHHESNLLCLWKPLNEKSLSRLPLNVVSHKVIFVCPCAKIKAKCYGSRGVATRKWLAVARLGLAGCCPKQSRLIPRIAHSSMAPVGWPSLSYRLLVETHTQLSISLGLKWLLDKKERTFQKHRRLRGCECGQERSGLLSRRSEESFAAGGNGQPVAGHCVDAQQQQQQQQHSSSLNWPLVSTMVSF